MRAAFILFIIFVSILVNSDNAFACSCVVPGTPREEFDRFDAVFLGKVLNIDSLGYGYNIEFEVEKSWKGISEKEVVIGTGDGGGDCGYSFEKNEEYVVYAYDDYDVVYAYDDYAYDDDMGLKTGICSRTAKLEYAQEDLQQFDEGVIPTQTGGEIESPNLVLGISIVGFILLIVGAVYFLRKHKK